MEFRLISGSVAAHFLTFRNFQIGTHRTPKWMIFFCSSIYYAFWKTPRWTVDIYIIIRFQRKFNFEIRTLLAVKNKEILELKLRTKKKRTTINLCFQKDVKPAVYQGAQFFLIIRYSVVGVRRCYLIEFPD